ncbi:hypothetical protein [Leptothoe spongobia]|uniref:Uncharacterized protein n=1 Tax=Leptothoe spongobia TAU-MAC 1115 TaxID=1967444 RepID=A0A947DIC4_9CYAN|nr:hypothetical protein [Leptothoe spongobia]MBT9317551.1 hypothetical protein [Leptothoe spongobia TAU-MAC 1115]
MAYLSFRPHCPKFIQSALVLLSATLLSSLSPITALADAVSNAPLADGVYLYGQQSVAAQPGSIYMVFEVTGRQTVGAFYMPSSSFDCFNGDISSTRLDLNVIDSYEQTSHPYSLAVQSETLAAGQVGPELSISGFTPISALSELDEQILETCQTVQADII